MNELADASVSLGSTEASTSESVVKEAMQQPCHMACSGEPAECLETSKTPMLGSSRSFASMNSPRLDSLPRPSSPAGPLPPVAPPRRKISSRDSFADPDITQKPSAMMLDLGSDSRPSSKRCKSSTCDRKLSKMPPQPSHETLAWKQGLGFLPPILGTKSSGSCASKLPPLKHSGSMDTLIWGVAPAKSPAEWARMQAVH